MRDSFANDAANLDAAAFRIFVEHEEANGSRAPPWGVDLAGAMTPQQGKSAPK